MIYTPTKHTKNPKASHASRPCVFPNQLAERIHHHNSHTCSSTGRPKSRSLPCFLPMCSFKPDFPTNTLPHFNQTNPMAPSYVFLHPHSAATNSSTNVTLQNSKHSMLSLLVFPHTNLSMNTLPHTWQSTATSDPASDPDPPSVTLMVPTHVSPHFRLATNILSTLLTLEPRSASVLPDHMPS